MSSHIPEEVADFKPLYEPGVEIRAPSSTVREPSTRCYEGSLDTICPSTIDLDALAALQPEDDILQHYIRVLSDPESFRDLLVVPPEEFPAGFRRGISRRMIQHAEDLSAWRIVRTPKHVRAITNFFTVPKKSGKLRLVVDGRRVNKMMTTTPSMDLPSIHEFADYLLDNNYFMTVDGKSYFYQFPISEGMGEFFCANLSGSKGNFLPVALSRMPMGWSWAPAIAQKASNTLLRDGEEILGMAWVDNFVFAGKSEEEVHTNFARFLEKADKVNLQLDSRECKPTPCGVVLGLDFDLKKHRYRLDPSWASEKAKSPLSRWMSPRQIFRATGAGIWSLYTRRRPLFKWSSILELIREVASLVAQGLNWDTPLRLTLAQLQDLTHWLQEIEENEWASAPSKVIPELDVWSDASDEEWAFLTTVTDSLLMAGPSQQGFFAHSEWHIFIKEAYAAHKAVTATQGCPRRLMIDNQALVFAIKKKCSSNKLVNELFSSWDWENITVQWVDTKTQLADPYTRGCIL